MANIEIDINSYISEEEKRELAIQVFKERIENELFKAPKGTVIADSEVQRIIGNITSSVVISEISKYIPDYKEKINKKVSEAISKDISYYVFKKKDSWGGEDSIAIKYIN